MRLRVLEDAGRLNIPFTTGLLVGIGETLTERAESIFALRQVSREFGHVQEVIVQNFRAKPDTAMRHVDDLGLEEYLAAIATTRVVLGPAVRVQAPPNLVDLDRVPGAAGRRHRRLRRHQPADARPRQSRTPVAAARRARRAVPGGRVRAAGAPDRPPAVPGRAVARPAACGRTSMRWRGPDGLAEPDGHARRACRGRSPTAGWATQRPQRTCTPPIDTEGRRQDRRGDFDDVYGDWTSLRRRRGVERGTDASGHRRRARRCGPPSATRPSSATDHALALMTRRGPGARGAVRAGRRPAPRRGGRRGHLRRQPEHQLHERLLHRLPVLRLRPAQDRRGRLHALARRDRRAGARGVATSAPPRCACRAASTRSCPARPTPTSPVP